MSIAEGNNFRDVVRWERDDAGRLSREVVTVASGEDLAMGAVLGKVTKSVPATGAAPGSPSANTGGGSCTDVSGGIATQIGEYLLTCIGVEAGSLVVPTTGSAPSESPMNTGAGTVTAVTGGAAVKKGIYTITCVEVVASPASKTFQVRDPDGNLLPPAGIGAYTSAQLNFTIADGSPEIAEGDLWTIEVTEADHDSGVFTVTAPDGTALPVALAGVAYTNPQINFTINDGSPDFVAGDAFTISVTEGSGQVKGIDFDAVDGTQEAYGILTDDIEVAVTSPPTTGSAVAIVKDAVIIAANLVWPATSPAVTEDQKAAALSQLAARGIVARPEA